MNKLRTVPLDGALITFDRASGVSVVTQGDQTRALVQRAPRVVQFGITNACNLSCSFCSRDLGAKSAWTAESAFEILAALASEGVLEVAFGGGEPFLFKGFVELIRRLHEETTLAVNITTNGTRLDAATLAQIEGWVGQIRLSIYDDNDWRSSLALLAASEVRFGVNLLVTPARLPHLAQLVVEMTSRGARDVLFLGYHGPDPAMHLTPAQDRALARSVRLLARACPGTRLALDVCFGERMADLPRAHLGAQRPDCGAGRDFMVITSDKRVSPCSFHGDGFPIASAADVSRIFAVEHARLSAPVDDPGCMRLPAQRRRLPVLGLEAG